MLRRIILAVFVLLSTLTLYAEIHSGSELQVASGLPAADFVPGEVLVKFKAQTAARLAQASNDQVGAQPIRVFQDIGVQHVKLPPGMSVEAAVRNYLSNPGVEYAEPNYIRYLARIPNDPAFPYLWGLRNTGQAVNGTAGASGADIRAADAWDLSTGSSSITVAVVDSGVDYNHPDLSDNISALRYDFLRNSTAPLDRYGHGTHIAGTISAVGNNTAGVTGVNWTAKIMPLRVGNATSFSTAAVIEAYNYARTNGARIINSSFGGTGFSQAEYDAIVAARNAGMLLVAAAGNESSNNDLTPYYPASYGLDNIISVAATDQNDQFCAFSNYGTSSVHVGAPGTNIYSTGPNRQIVWSETFEGGIAAWTSGGANNTWGTTAAQKHGGSWSLAVQPAGNYLNNANAWIASPAINLSGRTAVHLSFYLTGVTDSADILYIDAWNGSAWVNVAYASGNYLDSWYPARIDLGAYDGLNPFYVRFRFVSDGTGSNTGFFIDDVEITSAGSAYDGTEYLLMSGTSAATSHVSGLAALVWGYKPNLSYSQVRSIIMGSVDAKASLSGKVSTGGRINAHSALLQAAALTETPVPATPVSSGGGGGGGGGCFVATAAFGSPRDRHVQVLRDFRDRFLLTNAPGRRVTAWYYRTSPSLADSIRGNEALRAVTRVCLLPAFGMAYALLQFGPLACFAVLLGLSAACMIGRRGRHKRSLRASS